MILLEKIDSFLNLITMYRLVLYVLAVLSSIAILLGFLGILPFSGLQLLQSLLVILATCFTFNKLFSKVSNADTNVESFWISAFILFLILTPIASRSDFLVTFLISITAMASKYFLTFDKKHIFNPAGIACFLAGLFGFGNTVWWVSNLFLLPFVAILGLLVVRKIRRFQLFFTFIASGVFSIILFNFLRGVNIENSLVRVFTTWPLMFFGTIMLTEPFTTPLNKRYRTVYAILIGFLFGPQFSLGPLFASPEFALIMGNIFSFIVNPKGKLILKFKEKIQLAPTIYEFIFTPNSNLAYLPGQYMEWTMPHKKPDSRGIRRYFTIASSPQENDIKLGVKIIPDKHSSFKEALLNIKSGARLTADQLSGDFVMPPNLNQKLVFVAGGIGVTPFRSMIKNVIETGKVVDILLFYSASDLNEFVYKEILKKAEDLGIKTIYVLGGSNSPPKKWTGETGYLTQDLIKKYVPDFQKRIFYLSGPVAMVNNYKNLLNRLGIHYSKIVTDYFPGF